MTTFKLMSRVDRLEIKSYGVVSDEEQYLNPSSSGIYYEGELVVFDDTGKKVQRATAATDAAYFLFIETYGPESVAMPTKKVPIILGPEFDAETTLFKGSVGDYSPNQLLVASTETIDSFTRSVIAPWSASSVAGAHTDYIIGIVRYAADGKVRFRGFAPKPIYYTV